MLKLYAVAIALQIVMATIWLYDLIHWEQPLVAAFWVTWGYGFALFYAIRVRKLKRAED